MAWISGTRTFLFRTIQAKKMNERIGSLYNQLANEIRLLFGDFAANRTEEADRRLEALELVIANLRREMGTRG